MHSSFKNSMTTCALPRAFLWQILKKPLLEHSMSFFNSVMFPLEEASQNKIFLPQKHHGNKFPPSFNNYQEKKNKRFLTPYYTEITASSLGQTRILLLCSHNSRMQNCRSTETSRQSSQLQRSSPTTER